MKKKIILKVIKKNISNDKKYEDFYYFHIVKIKGKKVCFDGDSIK